MITEAEMKAALDGTFHVWMQNLGVFEAVTVAKDFCPSKDRWQDYEKDRLAQEARDRRLKLLAKQERERLAKLPPMPPPVAGERISLARVLAAISRVWSTTPEKVMQKGRVKPHVHARAHAIYIMRQRRPDLSWGALGEMFDRDRTSVMSMFENFDPKGFRRWVEAVDKILDDGVSK